MVQIYIAGPLFNTHERLYLEQIAQSLEEKGYSTFLPHRDAGVLNALNSTERSRLFNADLDALDKSDVCVALLTGADHDSGTSAELGYMFAKGKPCFGVTDDIRWMNNLIWGLCDMGHNIAKDIDSLVALIESKMSLNGKV